MMVMMLPSLVSHVNYSRVYSFIFVVGGDADVGDVLISLARQCLGQPISPADSCFELRHEQKFKMHSFMKSGKGTLLASALSHLIPKSRPISLSSTRRFDIPTMTDPRAKLAPAARVAGRKQDVW